MNQISRSQILSPHAQDLDDLEDTTADGVLTQAEYESLDNWRFNQALLASSENSADALQDRLLRIPRRMLSNQPPHKTSSPESS